MIAVALFDRVTDTMIVAHGSLIDDDGVLVLSTARQMAEIGAKGFDYNFPAELLEYMAEGRIVAWETGGEGEFAVEVVYAEEVPAGSLGAFRLAVHTDDVGIVMPYSQFSFAAACRDGLVLEAVGLAIRFPIRSGEHQVFVSKSAEGFRLTITPPRFGLAALSDDLPWVQ